MCLKTLLLIGFFEYYCWTGQKLGWIKRITVTNCFKILVFMVEFVCLCLEFDLILGLIVGLLIRGYSHEMIKDTIYGSKKPTSDKIYYVTILC